MNEPTVFQRLSSLSDETRARLLHVLEGHELTVGELCSVVQLPQSTVSRHLRILSDEEWVASRAEGTSRYYRASARRDPDAERLWDVVRGSLAGSPESAQDVERAREVAARRSTGSKQFFRTAAGKWDSVRRDLFGARPEYPALLALLDRDWVVGDLGCGTGQLTEALAPYVAKVVAVDESPDMLEAAGRRLESCIESGAVELREGRLESLPVEGGELDVALVSLVLHYVPDPLGALQEAARVLRPGGRVLVVDMVAHGRQEYAQQMGHQWQGFSREQIEGWLESAGFEGVLYAHLPIDEDASGPVLFVARAQRT